MSPERDEHVDEHEQELYEDVPPRSIFAATWFRVVLVVIVLGVIGAVAVPYVLDWMNPPPPPRSASVSKSPMVPAPAPATSALPTTGTDQSVSDKSSGDKSSSSGTSDKSSTTSDKSSADKKDTSATMPAPVPPASMSARTDTPTETKPSTKGDAKTTAKPAPKPDTSTADAKAKSNIAAADSDKSSASSPGSASKATTAKPGATSKPSVAKSDSATTKSDSAAPKSDSAAATASKPSTPRTASAKATPATPATGGAPYWVQVGAFKDEAAAKKLAAKLRDENFKVEESLKSTGGGAAAAPAPPAKAPAASSAPAGADQYDVFVSGMSADDLNKRLAGKGLSAEAASGGVVVKPSLPLRDAVALSKDLAVDGFKVQVRRSGGSSPAAAPAPAPAPAASTDGGSALHRVRVGAFSDRAAAVAAARELEAKGYKPYIARGDQ